MNIPPTFIPSDLENIDFSIFEWINDTLDIKVSNNEGAEKVPVIFSSPERSWSSKAIKADRKDQVTLRYPLISITRTNISKPKSKDGALQGTAYNANPFMQAIPVYTELNAEKTSDRANTDSKRYAGTLNSKKIKTSRKIYNIYNIPFPTYIEVEYSISMISNFQAQMNILLQPFIKYSRNINGFKIIRQGHGYECFINDIISDNHNLDNFNEEERKIEYFFTLKVKGYIHVGDINDKGPVILRSENQPELVIKNLLLNDVVKRKDNKTSVNTKGSSEANITPERFYTQAQIEAIVDARIALLYGVGPITDVGD